MAEITIKPEMEYQFIALLYKKDSDFHFSVLLFLFGGFMLMNPLVWWIIGKGVVLGNFLSIGFGLVVTLFAYALWPKRKININVFQDTISFCIPGFLPIKRNINLLFNQIEFIKYSDDSNILISVKTDKYPLNSYKYAIIDAMAKKVYYRIPINGADKNRINEITQYVNDKIK